MMRTTTRGWRGQPSWLCYYAMPLGKHYHCIECPVAGDAVPVTYEEAQARKLTPCKVCKPTPI